MGLLDPYSYTGAYDPYRNAMQQMQPYVAPKPKQVEIESIADGELFSFFPQDGNVYVKLDDEACMCVKVGTIHRSSMSIKTIGAVGYFDNPHCPVTTATLVFRKTI